MNPSWNGGLPPGIVTPDKISEGGIQLGLLLDISAWVPTLLALYLTLFSRETDTRITLYSTLVVALQ